MTSESKIEWNKFDDVVSAKRWIITGKSFPNAPCEFTHDLHLQNLSLEKYKTILDFGCGVGRNIPYLLKHSNAQIYAYDFPNMIGLAHQNLGEIAWQIKWITTPIHNLTYHHFDLIIATLVFQHCEPSEIHGLFKHLQGKECYVMGRGCLDDLKTNKWKILTEHLDPITPLDIDNGSRKHQSCLFKCKK